MMRIDVDVTPQQLRPQLERMFELSAAKIQMLARRWDPANGAPVYTRAGRYTTRGWTEWTQGFQIGSALLHYDATGDGDFFALGRSGTRAVMDPHVSHGGVHDHGFNVVSTYGALWRLAGQGCPLVSDDERRCCELALKVSGAIQARRWTTTAEGGFIYSFNGPHSLFIDTMRSLRSLALAHMLGHVLLDEGDRRISLFDRLVTHALMTARFNVYYGEGRDAYDVRGRVAHEAIFNVNDGSFRCPSTQQGYSPFTTWTRGLAWAMLGFAEVLEYMVACRQNDAERDKEEGNGYQSVIAALERAACVTSDYYLLEVPTDGVPYWDTGAPGLVHLGDYRSRPADPFNDREPVDSSAAVIAAQGLLRLGRYLIARGEAAAGQRYWQAGLTMTATLVDLPYLSIDPSHEGLLLHVVYHRPNGWDYVQPGAQIPWGESAMWGDYHLRELGLLLLREARGDPYLTFFGSEHPPSLSVGSTATHAGDG